MSPTSPTYVYVVRPTDPNDDAAAFHDQGDAERYAVTFDDLGAEDVETVVVCDGLMAAKMIAERSDEDAPRAIALTDADMVDLKQGHAINAADKDGNEINLQVDDEETKTLQAGGSIDREEFDRIRGEDVSYTISYREEGTRS